MAVALAQQAERSPSVAMNGLVAERMCSFCHRIAPARQADVEAGAPDFVDIADQPGRDAAFLRQVTNQTHLVRSVGQPPIAMPTILLTPESREDVIAYILTFQLDPATGRLPPRPLR
jgi:hypothetical protein